LASVQATPTPSIPKAAFASVFASGYNAASQGWSPFGDTLPLKTSQVNVCSRGIASGPRATAQIFFLDLPYNVLPIAVQGPRPGDGIQGGTTANSFRVTEESSSSNVIACVKAANATGGYSIGLVSAGSDLSANGGGTRFVSIDGVGPGSATARDGIYQWVYESFYNVSKKVPSTATTQFANAFGAALGRITTFNATSAAVQNGLLVPPQNCGGLAASTPLCGRVTRNGDSRQPLRFP
jgi:hypothetical protein